MSLTTDLNRGVFDGHNAGHDVHDPLRTNDNVIFQEVIVKILHSAEVMQELDGTLDLEYDNNRSCRNWTALLIWNMTTTDHVGTGRHS